MKSCSRCGLPIPTDSPEGICARCLLCVAIRSDGSDTIDAPAAQAISPTGTPPTRSTIDIADSSEVARLLPQFEIMELLGRGGMGVVYKARQIQLDRIVALKILPPAEANSPGFVERFRREARSLAKLSHPNIVHLYEFGESRGLYYFVMEFVDGANLRQAIVAHRLTAAEALAVVPKICDALQFAHEEGVVHRDIKPENILIDRKGRVKIADFGLAKLLGREEIDPRLTVTGATLGTPRYMAPEQIEKPETVDQRADIYSLGVVFYEMLTGEVPMGRFAPPSQRVQIDVRFDDVVLKALEHDRERRYQHASELRTSIEAVRAPALAPSASAGAETPGIPAESVPGVIAPIPVAEYAAPSPSPRLSRMAIIAMLCGGSGGVFGLILVIVAVSSNIQSIYSPLPKWAIEELSAGIMVLGLSGLAMTLMGAIAVKHIRRSPAKLYGLRLALLEALSLPLLVLDVAVAALVEVVVSKFLHGGVPVTFAAVFSLFPLAAIAMDPLIYWWIWKSCRLIPPGSSSRSPH